MSGAESTIRIGCEGCANGRTLRASGLESGMIAVAACAKINARLSTKLGVVVPYQVTQKVETPGVQISGVFGFGMEAPQSCANICTEVPFVVDMIAAALIERGVTPQVT